MSKKNIKENQKPLLTNEISLQSQQIKEVLENLNKNIKSSHDIEVINKLCEEVEERIRGLANYDAINPSEKRQQAMMLSEFNQEFQKTLTKIENRVQSSQQNLIFSELNNDLLIQRRQQLADLQKKIEKVNEIMKDCAEATNSQGEMIDRIDSEISDAKENAQGIASELSISKKRQAHKRSLCLCALIIICVVLLTAGIVSIVLGR